MLEPYLASIDPLLHQAWADCLRWSITDLRILAAFQASTGCQWIPGTTPLARKIDAPTGAEVAALEQYVAWFHVHVWGAGEQYPH